MRGPVLDTEIVSRFILFSRWVRADGTVRQDAFIPDERLELSVTRSSDVPERDIWDIAEGVSHRSGRSLYGLANVGVEIIRSNKLNVKATPLPENPHHADIVDWPVRKDEQKMAALAVAARSKFLSRI